MNGKKINKVYSSLNNNGGGKFQASNRSSSFSNFNNYQKLNKPGLSLKWTSTMHDWMNIVRSPTRYRVGGNRLSLKSNTRYLIMGIGVTLVLVLLYVLASKNSHLNEDADGGAESKFIAKYSYDIYRDGARKEYDTRYPLTSPLINSRDHSRTYRLLAVADLDTSSKLESKFVSYLLDGRLTISDDLKEARVQFDSKPNEVSSQYAYADRGMELSELVVFNGKLYSCDDRTGIIYEIKIDQKMAVPWVILVDGDGNSTTKGFKCEWMTVKERKLYVGGLGKEWTTAKGVLVNRFPQWIKVSVLFNRSSHNLILVFINI